MQSLRLKNTLAPSRTHGGGHMMSLIGNRTTTERDVQCFSNRSHHNAAAPLHSGSCQTLLNNRAGLSANVEEVSTSYCNDSEGAARILTSRIKRATSWQGLQQVMEQHGAIVNYIHISSAVTRLPKLVSPQQLQPHHLTAIKQFYKQLLQQAYEMLPEMGAREISNLLWASAKLGIHPGKAWLDAFLSAAFTKFDNFGYQDIGSTIWAVAKYCYYPTPQWMDAFLAQASSSLSKLDDQAVSNLLWSLAQMNYHPSRAFLEAAEAATQVQLQVWSPQSCANMLWAFARLGHQPSDSWLRTVLFHISNITHLMKPQELSMILMSLGKLGACTSVAMASSHAVPHLCSRLTRQLHELTCTEVSWALWGLAMLGYSPGQASLEQWLSATEPSLHTLDSKSLANLLYAVHRLSHLGPNSTAQTQDATTGAHAFVVPSTWAAAYLEASSGQFHNMDSHCLTTTIFCLASFQLQPTQEWLSAYFTCSGQLLSSYNPAELMNTACAIAKLGLQPPPLWQSIFVNQIHALLPSFRPKEAANTALALAKMGLQLPSTQQLQQLFESQAAAVCMRDVQQLGKAARLVHQRWPWLARLRASVMEQQARTGQLSASG